MDDFPVSSWLLCFQVVLALLNEACQPSYLAQELPIESTDMIKPKFQATYITCFTVSCLLFMVSCGGPEEPSDVQAAKPQKPVSSPTPSAPKETGKMAIPFDIAIQAALEGHTGTVKQALETGTDPNQVDENGRTMLMVAAFNGHAAIVEYLIDQGTKVDTRDTAGRTALMFASTGPNTPTVQLLLDRKAEVNLVDNEEHWSALMFAAAEGHQEVVGLLIDNEADLSLADIDGSTAESFARDNGHVEVADFLKAQAEK